MGTCRVSHHVNVGQVKAVLARIGENKAYHCIHVLHACGKHIFRCKTITEVHNREPMLRHLHAVVLVDIFVPVDPPSPVNINYHWKRTFGRAGAVDIKKVPYRIRPVADVVKADYVVRGSQACVLPLIGKLTGLGKQF